MEFNLALMGAEASGKSAAIRAISEIEVLDTEQVATDGLSVGNVSTTVAMDVGVISLREGNRIRLYGTPGRKRFDFMWDIVLQQCDGVLLVINHAKETRVTDLDFYWREARARSGSRGLPVVVCISHVDQNPSVPLSVYSDYFRHGHGMGGSDMPPIMSMDTRKSPQVRSALIAMTALLEMRQRFERDPRGRAAGASLVMEHEKQHAH